MSAQTSRSGAPRKAKGRRSGAPPEPANPLAADVERLKRFGEGLDRAREGVVEEDWSAPPPRKPNGGGKPPPQAIKGSVHDRPVNEDRGEVEVVLDGIKFIMTPTPWASRAIEQAVPWSLSRMLTYAAQGDLKLEELAVVVAEGLRATGEDGATHDKVVELVWKTGAREVVAPVAVYLHNCLTGGRPPAKKKTGSTASPTASG